MAQKVRPLLILQVLGATNLAAKDQHVELKQKGVLSGPKAEVTRSSDPFCVIQYLDGKDKVIFEEKTQTVMKDLNPKWGYASTPYVNEQVSYELRDKIEAEVQRIKLLVWDWDKVGGNDFLGQYIIDLRGEDSISFENNNFKLLPRNDKDKGIQGHIQISLNYKIAKLVREEAQAMAEKARQKAEEEKQRAEAQRLAAIRQHESKRHEELKKQGDPMQFFIRPKLILKVHRGVNLAAKDRAKKGKGATSDPYLKIKYLSKDLKKIWVDKSPVHEGDLDPAFQWLSDPFDNSAVSEETKDELQTSLHSIAIQVWDHDKGQRDDFLGLARISFYDGEVKKDRMEFSDTSMALISRPNKKDFVQGEIVVSLTYKSPAAIEHDARNPPAPKLEVKSSKTVSALSRTSDAGSAGSAGSAATSPVPSALSPIPSPSPTQPLVAPKTQDNPSTPLISKQTEDGPCASCVLL